MALINEDFIRCSECNNPHFREEEQLVLSKTLRERDRKTEALPAMERHIIYKCTQCGHPLDR